MMKFNRVVLLLLSGTILFSCKNNSNNSELVNPVEEGNAYAGMYVSSAQKSLRVNDTQNSESGLSTEQTMTALDLLSTAGNYNWTSGAENEEGKFWKTSGADFYTVAPWKTKAGDQTMALVINKGTLNANIVAAKKDMVFGAGTSLKTDIEALTKDDNFVMTSTVEDKNIKDGISKDAVKGVAGAADETKNVFAFDVERVVVKGLVAKASTLEAETKDKQGTINLDKLTYAAINGAAKTYLFATKAGERQIQADNQYTGFESAIDALYPTFSDAKEATTVAEDLVRLGNISSTSNADLGGYQAISVYNDATLAKAAKGIYFLENSVADLKDEANKNDGFYRLAYAKVYATFTPKKVLAWDDTDERLKEEDIAEGTTFYKGADDNLLYKSVKAAQKAIPSQKVYTYTNGRCFYRALWNRQVTVAGTKETLVNANVRRNNIYLIQIDGFQGLGSAWDPSDPKDPNLPKPTTPEEGETPEDPDVEKQDTYMRVTAKILDWNLVTRKVTLE